MTMTTAHLDVLKYLWVGFRIEDRSILAPNGKVVCRVLGRTLTELAHANLIEYDGTRYRLTDAGRERVLVKERVRDFCDSLTHSPTESC